MKWYYSRRGKVYEHGLVDDETLHDMAAKGLLSPDDLIWGELSNSGWVPASTLVNLFPPRKTGEAESKHGRQEEVVPVKPAPAGVNRERSKAGPVLMVIACIAGIGLWLVDTMKEPAEVTQTLENTGAGTAEDLMQWREKITQMDVRLIRKDPRKAERQLNEIPADLRGNEKVRAFAQALEAVNKDLRRLALLKTELSAGKLNPATAGEMVKLWGEYENDKPFTDYLRGIITSQQKITESTAVSAVYAAACVNDPALFSEAIKAYRSLISAGSSPDVCLEIVKMCTSRNLSEQVVSLLNQFLQKQPVSSSVWLEHAAVMSELKDEKNALQSLKNAIDSDSDKKTIKEAARQDKRFDSIRETRIFRKYTD